MTPYTLRPLTIEDRPVVTPLLVREWGAVEVVALSLGGAVDASALPGWLAFDAGGEVAGLLTYLRRDGVAHLVTINAFARGVGSVLLSALVEECRATDVHRIDLTTTNDNTRALRFYQRAGFRLTALHVDAVTEARKRKPRIPLTGLDGIPIRDELTLSMELP